MSIDDFKGLMDQFDPASLLPELGPIFEKFASAARIVVLIGPAVLLLMGLLYLFASPKEANHYVGYRCYYGMGSMEAWRFSQRLAGIVWSVLGVGLGIAMLVISGSFAKLDTMDLLWKVVYCVAAEAVLTAIACIAVNTVIILLVYAVKPTFMELAIYGGTQFLGLNFYTGDWLREYGAGAPNGVLWTIAAQLQFFIIAPLFHKLFKKVSLKWGLGLIGGLTAFSIALRPLPLCRYRSAPSK